MSKRLVDGKTYITRQIMDRGRHTPRSNDYMFGRSYGTRYKSQFNLSDCIYDTRFMEYTVDWFIHHFRDDLFNLQLCGREWSALPLITGLQMGIFYKNSVRVNAFHVRKNRKTYGRHNIIEGTPNGHKVVIVDALCNSTENYLKCYQICKHYELPMHDYHFAILNKYSRKVFGSEMDCDRYSYQKCKWIVERDELYAKTNTRK